MREVVCLLEIDTNDKEMWEMVDPAKGECIEYFRTKDAAKAYAKANYLKITEWVIN